jgi:hypothetical protein
VSFAAPRLRPQSPAITATTPFLGRQGRPRPDRRYGDSRSRLSDKAFIKIRLRDPAGDYRERDWRDAGHHYGRQPPSPPIVIQAPPSASEDAMVQSLREEHELVASFMKRNRERASDPEGSGSATMQVASVAPISLSLVDPPLPEPRPGPKKRRQGSRQNPRPGKSLRLLRRRRLSRAPLRPCQRPPSYRPPRRHRLKLSSSQGRGRSSASPAKCASGSRSRSGDRARRVPAQSTGLVLGAAVRPDAQLLPAELTLKAH